MEKIMTERLNDDCIDTYAHDALELAKKLFPLNRSINSPGTLQTLKELQVSVPQMKIKQFEAGNKVLDWNIPKRWEVRKASIKRLNGETVLDLNDSNLHVIAHSIPIKAKVKFIDLKESIYTLIEKPDAIPYRTSFYKEAWGFCMEHSKFLLMHDDEYLVEIDSIFTNQPMPYGEIFVPGLNEEKEVLFSTYICHPSMANNELSGPVTAITLAKYLLSLGEKPNLSYRFLFMPETIGAIAYISSNINALRENVVCGLVLTCVGDENNFSIVKNKNNRNYLEEVMIDECKKLATKYNSPLKIYDFSVRQSDERQYCSPGVDLPISCFCRSKYGSYPEYHTSDDNFNVVTKKGLAGSIEALINCVKLLEKARFPKHVFLCEPNLGKRGLYPLMGAKKISLRVKNIKDFLAYADGLTTLEKIADQLNLNVAKANSLYDLLIEKGIIK